MRKRISAKIQQRIWKQAENRCGYCLSKQDYVWDILQIDHIIPLSKGGTDVESNLWIVCGICNRAKSDKTGAFDKETKTNLALFNPRLQSWFEHFAWTTDGTTIISQTAVGRVTVSALNLNRERFIIIRRNWVRAGSHPPRE